MSENDVLFALVAAGLTWKVTARAFAYLEKQRAAQRAAAARENSNASR